MVLVEVYSRRPACLAEREGLECSDSTRAARIPLQGSGLEPPATCPILVAQTRRVLRLRSPQIKPEPARGLLSNVVGGAQVVGAQVGAGVGTEVGVMSAEAWRGRGRRGVEMLHTGGRRNPEWLLFTSRHRSSRH